MNSVNFAITAILDTMTGNRVNQQSRLHQSGYVQPGGESGVNSLGALFGHFKASVNRHIDDSRTIARQRKDVKAILQMSDQALQDIGLTQLDVNDLRLGLVSLDTLNDRRDQNRDNETVRWRRLNQKRVIENVTDIEKTIPQTHELKKCA